MATQIANCSKLNSHSRLPTAVRAATAHNAFVPSHAWNSSSNSVLSDVIAERGGHDRQ